MKSVASALVLFASAADVAVPVLVVPAIALAVSTFAPPAQIVPQPAAGRGDAVLAADDQSRIHAG